MWHDICEDLGIDWHSLSFDIFGWNFVQSDMIKTYMDIAFDFINKGYNFLLDNYLLFFLFAVAFSFGGIRILSHTFKMMRL